MLYELIHKKAPYKGRRMEDVKKKIKENRVVFKKDVHPQIKDIIFQMLQMIPRKRPSVSELLSQHFFKEVQNKMNNPTLKQQLEIKKNFIKQDFKKKNFNGENLDYFKNKKKINLKNDFGLKNNKKIFLKKKKSDLNNLEKSKILYHNMHKNNEFIKKNHKMKSSKIINNTSKLGSKLAQKLFSSSRQIVQTEKKKSPQAQKKKLYQSFNIEQPIKNNIEIDKIKLKSSRFLNNRKLFQSFNNHIYESNEKSKSNPNNCINLNDQGNKQNDISELFKNNKIVFSKKKKINYEIIKEDETIKNSNNLFDKNNESLIKNTIIENSCIDNININKSLKKTPEKRDSSKENKNQKVLKKKQISKSPNLISNNLKKLLLKDKDLSKNNNKRNIIQKSTEKLLSRKKNISRHYVSYSKCNTSYSNNDFIPSKKLNTLLNRVKSQKSKKNLNQFPTSNNLNKSINKKINLNKNKNYQGQKLKHNRSVRYINCSWNSQAPSHNKSLSFNDMNLKTKLVLKRKDSIKDLKKKISNRQIKENDSKVQKKSGFLNIELDQTSNKKKKADLKHILPTLKRNHSTVAGIVPKIVKLTGSSNKLQETKKIQHRKMKKFDIQNYLQKKKASENFIQLNGKNKHSNNSKSFCHSHRIDELNPRTIFSKLKGYSHRGESKSQTNHTIDTYLNLGNKIQSNNISSNMYKGKNKQIIYQDKRKRIIRDFQTAPKMNYNSIIRKIDLNS